MSTRGSYFGVFKFHLFLWRGMNKIYGIAPGPEKRRFRDYHEVWLYFDLFGYKMEKHPKKVFTTPLTSNTSSLTKRVDFTPIIYRH
jgi:hypothetical protein